jgi:hypothetical protein
MAQISAEQALQVPQQLKKQGSDSGANTTGDSNSARKLLPDDAVTLLYSSNTLTNKTVKVDSFKGELGQDQAFIKETLKNKLSEYNLNPNTKIGIKKDMFGHLEILGSIRPSDINKLTEDLNNHSTFNESFQRLSQQQPTLNYVDNVVKISSAYGVSNTLFNSLISEKEEHNRLNDIAHRYEALKTNSAEQVNDITTEGSIEELKNNQTFQFVLNG